MAVHLATASDYLQRTTALLPASGNSTVCFWVNSGAISTAPAYQTGYIILDDPGVYVNYAGLFYYNDGGGHCHLLDVASTTLTSTTPTVSTWTHYAWVQSGTTQSLYTNGVFIGSITKNRSAFVDGFEFLGNDTGSDGDLTLAYCREWTAAITQNQIRAEMNSPTAVRTANLYMDCPLAVDALDVSGLGHGWSSIGSPTFVAQPPLLTNHNAATAMDLGTLPATVTQDFGINSEAWYSYTAESTTEIGMFAISNLTDSGELVCWTGPTSAPVHYLPSETILGVNRSVQLPVTEGTTYYFQVFYLGPPTDDVVVSGVLGPTGVIPTGAICINDDTDGFPLAVLSSTTGLPITFVQPFPASERGDPATNSTILPSGILLTDDIGADIFRIYSPTLSLVTSVPYPFVGTPEAVSSDQDATFYVSGWPTAGNSRVATISDAGVVGATTWTLSGHAFTLCPTLDNTTLLYATASAGSPIHSWNLIGNTANADFHAGAAGYVIHDILNLADGTFTVGYQKTSDSFIRHYAADGSILATYNSFGGATRVNHLCHAIDDPTSIWVWLFEVSGTSVTAFSRFVNLKISDGSFVTDIPSVAQYTIGSYGPTPTLTPYRFGHSNSCPFWIQRSSVTPIPPGVPVEYLIRRERWFPVISSGLKRQFFSELQIDMQTGNGISTGQGSNPLMEIDWSDDSGWTWSNIRFVETGRIGAYGWRPITRNLSYGRNRVFRIAVSDPVQWVVVGAELDAVLGTS